MRKGGGKAKGASFERDICRRLSLWVSHGQQEDVFWRSAMSGGRSTVAHAKGKKLGAQAGDISCIHPVGANFSNWFFCECKFYASLDFQGLLTRTGKLSSFWLTAWDESHKYSKHPMLIAKENRSATYICLSGAGLHILNPGEPVLIAPSLDIHIFDAEKFFKHTQPI